jgi:hypothetical protein
MIKFPSTVAIIILYLASLTPVARGDDDQDRQSLLKAFDILTDRSIAEYKKLKGAPVFLDRQNEEAQLVDKDFQSRIKSVDTPGGPSKLIVKVAFRLKEGANQGKYVVPERYVWGRKERARIWVETSVPVILSYYDVKTENGRDVSKRWFPRLDPDDKDPSWEPLHPGLHELSLRLWTDNDNNNERWVISVFAYGTQESPRPRVDDRRRVFLGEDDLVKVDAWTNNMRDQRAKGQSKDLVSRPAADSPIITPDRTAASIILSTSADRGHFELDIRKK